jgi:hypothetical protein
MNHIALSLLSRSLILFMTSVMAFVWRIGGQNDPFADVVNTCGRILITAVFGIGMIYLTLVLITLRTYGGVMDAKWRQRVEQWTQKHRTNFMFGSVPGQTLPPSGVNNCASHFWNSSQLPPAGVYTPVYVPPTQLPFYGWAQAVNQPQQDLSCWPMPRDGAMNGAMNDGGFIPIIPSQPVDETQDYRINLQSPTDLGSGSGRSSPVHESQHPHSSPRTFRHNLSLPPSPDTISMMNPSDEGIAPLRSFPVSSTPPTARTSPPCEPRTVHRPSSPTGRYSPPPPIGDQLRIHSVQDYPSRAAATTPHYGDSSTHLASQEPVSYSPHHATMTAPVTHSVHINTSCPNYQRSGATPDVEMRPLPSAPCCPPEPALHAPQPLRTGSTWFEFRDPPTGIPNHLPTVYEAGEFGQEHIGTAHETPEQRDGVVDGTSEGAGHRQTIMRMFRGRLRQDVGQPGPSHLYAIRPYCTRSAASILGNIAMGYGHPSLAATRDETHLGNWRSRE